MRESLLRKKLRLAADLKLLLPVTPEIVDIANTCFPAPIANHRRVIAFDGSIGSDGTRPVVVVFCEDGDCHLIDTYYNRSGSYFTETVPHGLDLVKEEARVSKLRRLSDADRERELLVRLFIHFIDAINPKLDNEPGQFMALDGAWSESKQGLPITEKVNSFQEYLEMIVWSDPAITTQDPCVLEWDGHAPDWDGDHDQTVDWTSREQFEEFRSSVLSGKWGSLNIESKSSLTERFAAACWCLCAQFQDSLVDMTTELEYNDDDWARRSGYTREYSSKLVQFVIRGPVNNTEREIAQSKYAQWLKRLQFYSAGWAHYSEKKVEFTGDTAGRSRTEMAALKKAFLAMEAGTQELFPYCAARGLHIPPILMAD
jgi:hypothetical protein